MSTFTDRTLVVSGGSRGIGLAIALGAAKHGANVVLLAKTAEPHPRLPGTVHTAVADVEAAGGKGVTVVGDVRKEEDVQRAVDAAVEHFGGIDIVINNASAIATEPTEDLSAKKFDLMMDINVRGTFLLTKTALPHLRKSVKAHVVTLAPPLNMNPHGDKMAARSRSPQIMADAAVEILSRPPAEVNGKCFVDSAVLAETGITDLSRYGGGDDPILDIFIDKL
jgi:NAD(P)-dependent dehydrogenase (short-subunit alcohol dehydrogenase family)